MACAHVAAYLDLERPGRHQNPRIFGGAEGIRTPDLLIANETRYQLRHSPKRGEG